VLSGNPFILILGIFAFGIFFYLLRIRASKKQIESFKEPQRMNWSWLWLRFGKNKKESNIIEGESEEISEDEKK
tara:strand:+ start:426 stop:647 length:222 start_codon:yes stop_codon:yes gene_type:complete